ncbi:hypothetical protein [Photobacterium kasasachensis]|uniref:hypothetical protein n=1 Tax=Photobacterium kasasachensis TaxID=2910240 RepID=UPI003D0EE3F2
MTNNQARAVFSAYPAHPFYTQYHHHKYPLHGLLCLHAQPVANHRIRCRVGSLYLADQNGCRLWLIPLRRLGNLVIKEG